MQLDSLLAVIDGTAAGTNAAWRAALVARDHGRPLRLLHGGDPIGTAELASELRAGVGIDVTVQAAEGDLLHDALAASRSASLLVIGSRRGNPLREWILGTQAERLIRLSRAPVLVVKRPAMAGYRRVLVPVDLAPEAAAVIAAAAMLSRDPRLEVFHALATREEVTMRAADVPEPVVRELRQRAAQLARGMLRELVAQAGAASGAALTGIGYGPAAGVILAKEQAMRAELVVMGKRRRGLLADFFLGGATQRVLARSRADVLVLPGAAPACAARNPAYENARA